MHLRGSRTSKFYRGSMPPDPPRVEGPLGLRQIYPPVTLKYPLVQKLIETPALNYVHFYSPVTAPLVLTQVSCSCVTALLQPVYSPEIMQTGLETGFYRALAGFMQGRIFWVQC